MQPAVWAGIECTINRVGDRFIDQCEKNGHRSRMGDLRRFSELGIQRLRYPFLWERHRPHPTSSIDWRDTDARMAELGEVGITPIVGLLHHGSGPVETNLLDGKFPEKFAEFAGEFAARFPEVTDYTPINEPLTTARFSGLYGVWYPHGRDDRKFLRCLYQQIRGTALAMRAIWKANPRARLIQTEDMGRASGTERLAYQVRFENERRWLSFDLLCGRVLPDHPLYSYLVAHGISEDELDWLVENPTPPQIIGINHYLLSNRYLDDRLEHYPDCLHGGNGRHAYADVGAVDTGAADLPSPASILREVWDRYGIPIAVTEVHVNGPREAQMQWFREIWQAAVALRSEGVAIEAVTVWSLLGSYDWNSLCTRSDGFYESGVYDLRSPEPRPTAMATFVRGLALSGNYDHPVLDLEGPWHSERRMIYARSLSAWPAAVRRRTARPLLLAGRDGLLGQAFARILDSRSLASLALSRESFDIADARKVREVLASVKPWAVINAAGYVPPVASVTDELRSFRDNVRGPEILAQECARIGIPLLSFSSGSVFAGSSLEAYAESSPIDPRSPHGKSQAEAERRVLGENPRSLMIRAGDLFSPWHRRGSLALLLRSLRFGHASNQPLNQRGIRTSQSYVPELVHTALDLLIDGEQGVIHLANGEGHSISDLCARILPHATRRFGVRDGLKSEITDAGAGFNHGLRSERVRILSSLDEAIEKYFRELDPALLETEEQPLATERGHPWVGDLRFKSEPEILVGVGL